MRVNKTISIMSLHFYQVNFFSMYSLVEVGSFEFDSVLKQNRSTEGCSKLKSCIKADLS